MKGRAQTENINKLDRAALEKPSPKSLTESDGGAVDLEIESLAYQGYGVARRSGQVHLVEGALPGERVRARALRRAARVVFAETTEVLAPSPRRVTPPCPVFGRCGGCQFLHAAYELQVEAKTEFVRAAFRGRPEASARIAPTAGAVSPFRFRNRMSYSIGGGPGTPVVGLHARRDPAAILPARDCVLAPEWHRELLERTTDLLRAHPDMARNAPRRLDLREGRRTGARMATLSPPPREGADAWVERFRNAVQTIVFSEAFPPGGEEPRHRAAFGSGVIEERLGPWRFEIGPHTFFQTYTEQAERMFAMAAVWAAEIAPARIVEFYAGVGALTAFLAGAAKEALAVERHGPSVAAARRNLRRNGIANVRFQGADAADFRPRDLSETAELVVVDPPRAGLSPKALRAAAAWRPGAILYVSCDPMTLARDVARFEEFGYRLERLQPFDLFPQTFHVESLALLRRST